MPRVAIVGGGPAGLMAAERLAAVDGLEVAVFDAMPSFGRKFLMAGKGGMNITHGEALADFVGRYGDRQADIGRLLERFGPQQLREWIAGLGIATFVGSSGRVFPTGMKAAPLLRAWLHRLRGQGVHFHVRHRWRGWAADGSLRFATPEGERQVAADAVVLALGGGSWARLGSDGAWVPLLAERGIPVEPLKPANCGFDVAWSAHFSERFAGDPVKPVIASIAGWRRQGEFNITAGGIEGGAGLCARCSVARRAGDRRARRAPSRPGAGPHAGLPGRRSGTPARPRFAGQPSASAGRNCRRQGRPAA